MNRPLRVLAAVTGLFLVLLIIGPLVIPVPPLPDIQPVEALADPDSRFLTANGLQVHYKEAGTDEPVMILLHGFGASVFSWREVMGPLSQYARVVAYDRPAFGLTERPLPGSWKGESPYGVEGNLTLLLGLMDALGMEKAILVGNSAGGRLAVQAALAHPERVSGLVLVDAAIYTGNRRPFGILQPLVHTPQMDRLGPFFARSLAGEQGEAFLRAAWHDPSRITPEIQAGYRKPLHMANWDAALWEFTKAGSGNEDLAPRLRGIFLPTLVISGENDQIIPAADSVRLASELPGARLAVLPACGHLPQEECPDLFLNPVIEFIRDHFSEALP
ncbi:predicted hydrolase [Anaerolinea thermolimosa]|uniref:alpha/beta fold hydrolase n=1 Tax=Anaerolinea thermolimosa TaxID=229919 RepID=UPI000781BB9D|nr:alpha/beta hydrolase [Anaerolinea thermolimosa]GAP05519.1 predicted hydrolase [Anaerolinea thermolimosa]